MPNVVGLEYPAALASMVAAGVRVLPLGYFQDDPVRLTWVTDPDVRSGFVISQTPQANTVVAANAITSLLVSDFTVSVADSPVSTPGIKACTLANTISMPGLAMPGCWMPGRRVPPGYSVNNIRS